MINKNCSEKLKPIYNHLRKSHVFTYVYYGISFFVVWFVLSLEQKIYIPYYDIILTFSLV